MAGVQVTHQGPRLGSIRSWAEKQLRTTHPDAAKAVVSFIKEYAGRLDQPVPFTGRDEAVAELDAWWGSQNGTLLPVKGAAGVGKSALLLHWLDCLLTRGERLGLVFMPVSYRFGTNDEVSGLRLLHAQLVGHFRELRFPADTEPSPSDYRASVQQGWQLMRRTISRYLLVIDGADEAASPWLLHNVLPYEIPENLSIVLSVPDKQDEAQGRGLVDAFRSGASGAIGDSLELGPLERRGVREALAELGHPLDDGGEGDEILDEFYRLTDKGNPLLVTLWASELWGGWGSLPDRSSEDLTVLAPGMGGFLDHWMKEQQTLWKHEGIEVHANDVERLLNILAVAHGPLRLHELLTIEEHLPSATRPREDMVRQILDEAKGVVVSDEKGVSYSFVNAGFKDEFLFRAEERGIQRSCFGQAILAWGADTVEALISGDLEATRCPAYLLRHYTTHVIKAGLAPEEALDRYLLGLFDPSWYQAWYTRERACTGFLWDLARVEEVARRVGQESETRVRRIGESIRASIGSVTRDIGAELIVSWVQLGFWSPERGLKAVEQFSDRENFAAVRSLVESPNFLLRTETLELAFLMSRRMVRSDSVAVLEALAELLRGPASERVLDAALAVVERTEDALWRVRALVTLVGHLEGQARQDALARALAASEGIEKGWLRSEALVELAAYLETHDRQNVLARALEVSEGIEDEWLQAEALMTAVGPVSEYPRLLARALATAAIFKSSTRRTRVLVAMGTHLESHPDLLEGSLEVAEEIQNVDFRAEALAMVAGHLEGYPELQRRTLEAAETVEANGRRGRVLEAVAAHAKGHRHLLERAMVAAEEVEDGEWRARVLFAVAPHVEEESRRAVLERALLAVEEIEDEGTRARTLSAVATQLQVRQALLEQVLAVTEAIEPGWLRREASAAFKGYLIRERPGEDGRPLDRLSVHRQHISGSYKITRDGVAVRSQLSERRSSRGRVEGRATQASGEPVHVTTMTPGAVKPGTRFFVRIVLHLQELDVPTADSRSVKESVAVLSLREGVVLTVRLVAVDNEVFLIDDCEARLVWGPPARQVEFRLRSADELPDGTYDLRVEYWCEGIQLARTYVEVVVDSGPRPSTRLPAVKRAQLPRSAFASYSRTDRARVADRVDSLKAAGIEVFLDCLDIQQGSDWQRVLELELLSREALFLFWSKAARKSEWVEKEWRFGLERRGIDFIVPNALEPPASCPPPPELASLQFGSILTLLAQQWAAEEPQQ